MCNNKNITKRYILHKKVKTFKTINKILKV